MKESALFVPDIERLVIGAPEPMIEREVINAAKEFLRNTLSWVHESPPQAIRTGTSEYTIVAPSGSRLEILQGVYAGDRRLIVSPMTAYPYSRDSRKGTPSYAYLTESERLRLYPEPDSDDIGDLRIQASLNIKEGANKVPDFLYNRYFDALVNGAVSRLAAQPGAAWSNPSLSVYHDQLFRRAQSTAKAARIRGNSTQSVMVNRRSFITGVR